MKKILFLLLLGTFLSISYGQEVIYLETCGNADVSSAKKVDNYTGWDNGVPVTYSRTISLDGYSDVRITSSTTNHIWFPADKNSDFIISAIPASGYKNMKLSFDIAAYKLTDANANKLIVFCNDSALAVPSTVFTSQKFIPISDIPLGRTNTITLKFEYTAGNNTCGYRLDNFKITGDKAFSDVCSPTETDFHPRICGTKLLIPALTDGSVVEILNLTGSIIRSSRLANGSIDLNSKITKGLFLVRAGQYTWKIVF